MIRIFIAGLLTLSVFWTTTYAEKIRVACIGDSITYGTRLKHRQTESYPAKLQQLLGSKYDVKNFGNPGRGVIKTSRRGKGWRAYIFQKSHTQALKFKPNIVICNLGINDIMEYAQKYEQFVPDYIELINSYKALPTKPKIFIWTKLAPLMPGQKFYNSPIPFLMRRDLNQVARKTGAIPIDMFSALNGRDELFTSDHLHPNAKGAELIAQETYRQIKSYLTGNFGGLKMPYIFTDNMVLQRNKPIPIFGTANVGEKITVTLNGQTQSTTTNNTGHWQVYLPKMKEGGPFKLTVASDNQKLVFKNILIGEVWIAAGQSNMYFPLKLCARGKQAIKESVKYNKLRLLNRIPTAYPSKKVWNSKTLARCTTDKYYIGKWQVCSPKTVQNFSGVAYFFARELIEKLNVPIGIINLSVGGTIVEAYISEEGLLDNPLLCPLICTYQAWYDNPFVPPWPRSRAKFNLQKWINCHTKYPLHHPFEPTFLFQAAIEPMIPFTFRGVIWYQGESNATLVRRPDGRNLQAYYQAGIETMVKDWRSRWQYNFPFYHVQLPNFSAQWMLFREAQRHTLSTIPNSGLVVAIDLGSPKTVHPKRKYQVGHRLALWALAKTYGKKLVYSGPMPTKLHKENNRLVIDFKYTGSGLITKDGKKLTGFEIAGKDGIYHSAIAEIKGNSVVVYSLKVNSPISVKYAWSPNPVCNLCNKEFLPAIPFIMSLAENDN